MRKLFIIFNKPIYQWKIDIFPRYKSLNCPKEKYQSTIGHRGLEGTTGHKICWNIPNFSMEKGSTKKINCVTDTALSFSLWCSSSHTMRQRKKMGSKFSASVFQKAENNFKKNMTLNFILWSLCVTSGFKMLEKRHDWFFYNQLANRSGVKNKP